MGDTVQYQPLTREDKITVVIYRIGIVVSSILVALGAYGAFNPGNWLNEGEFAALLLALYVSVGTSVFFIHLYISKFHRGLKKLYYVALVCLALLFVIGNGDVYSVFATRRYAPLFLLPLSGCLGFITAKEAFCFKLVEGYILAIGMPLYLVFLSLTGQTVASTPYGFVFIAVLLLLFTLRKVFMPLHYDIGDKSAYQ